MFLERVLIGLLLVGVCLTTASADVYRTVCGDDEMKVKFSVESDTNSKIGVLVDYDWNTKAAPGTSRSKISVLKVTSVGWYNPLVRVGLVDPKTHNTYIIDYFEQNATAQGPYTKDMEEATLRYPDYSTSRFSCALKD